MEIITSHYLNKADLLTKYKEILEKYYHLVDTSSEYLSSLSKLDEILGLLDVDLTFLIEWPYVDKVYRDTFYHYYASKKHDYSRMSVKISIFSDGVKEDQFYNIGGLEFLRGSYLGFFTLRPTFPSILGRNVISPLAFGETILICSTKLPSTANGVKFQSIGFPHSSQDGEMITCAETTVWSIMEYFGNKYSDYKPLLPSLINKTLGKFSFERLIPSKGLTAGQISYALKDFGFGVKIYSAHAYGTEFMKILKMYIESGIPVVGAMQNGRIGHAVNVIGRVDIVAADVAALPIVIKKNNIELSEFADLDIEYVFVDDNHAPYRKAKLTTPSSYYVGYPEWAGCTITNFIVPLYPKIYLEAGEARTKSISLIENSNLIKDKKICIRTFLASSRSFKDHLHFSDLPLVIKKLFNSLVVPKFIWVTEIYYDGSLMDGKCNGLVVLDATEPKKMGIITFIIEDTLCLYNFEKYFKIGAQYFTNYNQNLRKYEK